LIAPFSEHRSVHAFQALGVNSMGTVIQTMATNPAILLIASLDQFSTLSNFFSTTRGAEL